MNRRTFIKITATGIAVMVLGPRLTGCSSGDSGGALRVLDPDTPAQPLDPANFTLDIMEVEHEMVDGTLVYSWAYAALVPDPDNPEQLRHVPSLPGPTLFVREGQPIHLTLRNLMVPGERPPGEAHGLAIFGEHGALVQSQALAAGESDTVLIPGTLPPGTYLYEDNVNRPVGRLLGLHGALVVMPAVAYGAAEMPLRQGFTPYGAAATAPVMELFHDLGHAHHFPGEPWLPARQTLWLFSEIDPHYNTMARSQLIDSGDLQQHFLPQYFTLNGRSGFFSSEHKYHQPTQLPVDFNQPLSFLPGNLMDANIVGKVGQPLLIRSLNAGLDITSPHIHGNHGYVLTTNATVQGLHIGPNGFPIAGPDNRGVCWVDTWTLMPGESKDVLYPMTCPPDIPGDTWQRMQRGAWDPILNPLGSQEMMALEQGRPPQILNASMPPAAPGVFTNLHYPMHDHQELSQTAAGGNYPMGQVAHISFIGFVGDNNEHHGH